MSESCNLCNKERPLLNSHIFPKFIFRWMKESGTGALRGAWNLDQKIQDGTKAPFLCAECELLFSKAETYFARTIFYPIVNDELTEFGYNDNLLYFVVSVLWRLLKFDILISEKECSHYNLLVNVEKEWRQYLLHHRPLTIFDNIHLLIAIDPLNPDDLEDNNIVAPSRFAQYMGRITDGGLADSDEACMLYLKLPRFIFIIPLSGIDETLLVDTRIEKSGGHFNIDKPKILDPEIGAFFFDRVRMLNELFENISPIQREKMQQNSIDRWEEISNKDLGKIVQYDQKNYPLLP